ncbi:hypothetical protein [Staphylococcus hominis]
MLKKLKIALLIIVLAEKIRNAKRNKKEFHGIKIETNENGKSKITIC